MDAPASSWSMEAEPSSLTNSPPQTTGVRTEKSATGFWNVDPPETVTSAVAHVSLPWSFVTGALRLVVLTLRPSTVSVSGLVLACVGETEATSPWAISKLTNGAALGGSIVADTSACWPASTLTLCGSKVTCAAMIKRLAVAVSPAASVTRKSTPYSPGAPRSTTAPGPSVSKAVIGARESLRFVTCQL